MKTIKPFPPSIKPKEKVVKKKVRKKKVQFRKFYQRAFLNLPEKGSNAFISVNVAPGRWDNYQITITDCNEEITLHGALNKRESRANALQKVDTLLETLKDLREHMVSEFDRLGVKY